MTGISLNIATKETSITEVSPVIESLELKQSDARLIRNARLAATDWTQLRDSDPSKMEIWEVYRRELKDVTDTELWEENPIAAVDAIEEPV